jgi:hypothetical protein
MQLISCYLYSNKINVFTNATAAWKTERNRRVYNRNIKIYRGVDNRIDIQVRNSDQKAAATTGSTLVFNLVERESQRLVAVKDCVVADAATGKHYVTFTENELLDIEAGFYQYSVNKEERTQTAEGTHIVTSRTPLYGDSQYDIFGTIELYASSSGDVQNSTVIREFGRKIVYDDPRDDYYISSIIDARPEINSPQTLHTFQFFFTNYQGQVTLQGSISEGGNPQVWTDLLSWTPTSDADYKNVTGKYNWFRIKHIPVTGTVDKILYR